MNTKNKKFKLGLMTAGILFASSSAFAASTTLVTQVPGKTVLGTSNSPSVNTDGSKIAFSSNSGVFVSDNQIINHIYLKNTLNNTFSRVSVSSNETPADRISFSPSISGNGDRVAFYSLAKNLVTIDPASTTNVFVRNISAGTTTLVSSSSAGIPANGENIEAIISKDGNFVVFSSTATNLTNLNTNNKRQIYVKNLSTGELEIVSLKNSTTAADQDSFSPSISSDGRYVSFASFASNLPSTNAGTYDVYVHDRTTNTTEIISAGANSHSVQTTISGNGRFVAFITLANNLTSGDTNNQIDVIYFDRKNQTMHRVDTPTQLANGASFNPRFSDNGRFLTFYSSASNLVSGDTNGRDDMFVYDLALNKMEIASIRADGNQTNANVDNITSISGNGLIASFASPDSLMAPGDTNNLYDIFTRHRDLPQNVKPTAKAASIAMQECSYGSAYVTLDGSSSTAPLDNGLSYTWTGPFGTLNGAINSVYLSVGTHSITLTVENDWGTSSTTQNVTVTDSQFPSVSAAAPVTKEATSSNGAAHSVVYSASDACNLVNSTVSPSPAYYPLGTTNVTVSATDGVGHTATATTAVTVEDTTAPVLSIPGNISVEANNIRSIINIGDASATDYFLKSVTNNAPADYPLDSTSVTWTATDTSGNSSSKVQTITVVDSTKPELTLPADKSFEATAALSTVDFGTASAYDIFPVTVSNNAPTQFPVGTTTVIWTATDANNNSASANQLITLSDSIPPVITAPANVIAEATGADTMLDLASATATDAVGIASISSDAPAAFPIGVTTVTWTATDKAGNSSSAIQTVTVQDTTAPVISTPVNVSVEASGKLSTVTFDAPTATDAVGVTNLTNDAPATFPVGITTITWTATDAAGNTSTATQTITVEDTTAPVISVPVNVEVEATAADSVVAYDAPTATDAVGVVNLTHNAPATFPVGTTTITWTATDAAGNSSTTDQTITVVDTTKPSITAPVNVTMEATAALSTVDYTTPVASDIVGVTSFTNDAPATFPVGTTIITWTAKDAAGNINTATQSVTVTDTTAPVISAPINAEVEATAFNSVVDFQAPVSTDLVGVTSFTNDAPASFPVGTTTVTWTAIDAVGNTTTATQTVKVNDTTPATLTIPADMNVEANGNPSSIANLGSAKAVDIVDGDISTNIVVTEPANGYQLGVNTVNYSITDKASNINSGTQRVTIVDTTTPAFSTSNNKSGTAASVIEVIATAELTEVSIGQATATDFYLKSVTNDHPSTLFPVGETVVTWTAEDTSGNKSTYTQTVRVSYKFNGFQAPLKDGGVYKAGRVIPVKINLTYADGTPVEVAQPQISVFQTSNQEVVGEALDISSVSAADNGTTMRYSNNGDYIYNLDTSIVGKGTYQISVLAHSGSNVNVINIALK